MRRALTITIYLWNDYCKSCGCINPVNKARMHCIQYEIAHTNKRELIQQESKLSNNRTLLTFFLYYSSSSSSSLLLLLLFLYCSAVQIQTMHSMWQSEIENKQRMSLHLILFLCCYCGVLHFFFSIIELFFVEDFLLFQMKKNSSELTRCIHFCDVLAILRIWKTSRARTRKKEQTLNILRWTFCSVCLLNSNQC